MISTESVKGNCGMLGEVTNLPSSSITIKTDPPPTQIENRAYQLDGKGGEFMIPFFPQHR